MSQVNYQIRIDGIDIVSKNLHRFVIAETDIFNFNVKAQVLGNSKKKLNVVFIAAHSQ